MISLLLAIIYVSFISLGLPDAILGSAWPTMFRELGVSVSFAGVLSMIIAGGTIVSSLFSVNLIRRFGTGLVTTVSVALTALALLGYSFSDAFWQLCLWSIPYGLGAGSVDAALNNFVALHFKSRHMNWLHCFWGVGAAAGPYIMGLCLSGGFGWTSGYQIIGSLQAALVLGLIFSLPAWKKVQMGSDAGPEAHAKYHMLEILKLKGVKPVLMAFFCYCSLEITAGLWASSYLVLHRGISEETAAKMASLFYLGITAGRFVSGLVSGKMGDKRMIRLGQALTAFGFGLILLPLGEPALYAGLLAAGLGCAPIFPSLLHATPDNFGKERSQTIMGMQMAGAYTGSTLAPLFFGLIAGGGLIALYPYYLIFFMAVMIALSERANRVCTGAPDGAVPEPAQAGGVPVCADER